MSNRRNLLYFQKSSMKKLYKSINKWQKKNKKRLLSLEIQKENNIYCCIALTNPTEVTIVTEDGDNCCGGSHGNYYLNVRD